MIILIKRSFRVGLLKRFCWSFYEIRWVFFFLNRLVGSKDSLGSLGFGGLSEGFLGILWDWLVYSKDLLGLVSLFEEFLGILWDSLGFIDLYEGFLGILWDWLVYSKDPLGLASLLEGFSGILRDFLEFSGIFWDFFGILVTFSEFSILAGLWKDLKLGNAENWCHHLRVMDHQFHTLTTSWLLIDY